MKCIFGVLAFAAGALALQPLPRVEPYQNVTTITRATTIYTTVCPVTSIYTSGTKTLTTVYTTTSTITSCKGGCFPPTTTPHPVPVVTVTKATTIYTTVCPVTSTYTSGKSTYTTVYTTTSTVTTVIPHTTTIVPPPAPPHTTTVVPPPAPPPASSVVPPPAPPPICPPPVTITVYVTQTVCPAPPPLAPTTSAAPAPPKTSSAAPPPPAQTTSAAPAPPKSSSAAPPPPAKSSSAAPAPPKSSSASTPPPAKTSSTPVPPPASPTPASNKTCPANLSGPYQNPHLIVPVDSSKPTTPGGNSFNGVITSTVSSIFNFDIPSSYTGTCSLVFLFPLQKDLETSSFTFSGPGGFSFSQLTNIATTSTTFANQGPVKTSYGAKTLTPGTSAVISTFPCPAGQTVSYEISSLGGTSLTYFQDFNPSPIGLYVTTC